MQRYVTAQSSPCDHQRLFFILEHAAVLLLLLVVAAAAGTLVMGSGTSLALRSAMGMAVAGQTFIVLGTIGALRPWSLGAFAAIVIVAAVVMVARAGQRPTSRMGFVAAIVALPLFVLALYPPIAFDETLYHLPFVAAMARSGAIRFLTELRFPAFPQLHELLCVPAFLLAGDTATHLVALAEVVILAGLLIEWPPQRLAGVLAAALFLGNPIVIQMATVTHAEVALALFIAAGVYCLDRNTAAAGFLIGTACSVKYLGWYFAAAAVVYLLLLGSNRRRGIPLFVGSFLAGVLPMYARIITLTGNPFFPFLPKLFGTSAWTIPLPMPIAATTRIANALRLFWDITFARERLNFQPPYSPLFAVAMLITLIAATRDGRAAFLSAVCAGYIAIFTFLPQDSRYLMPLLPLVSIAAASSVVPMLRRKMIIALSLLAIAPGMAYAGYRLVRQGPPPLTAAQRRQYLEDHIPEYRAIERRGPGRIYVCGAEQLMYFGNDELLGDVVGPYTSQTILGNSADSEQLSRTLARLHVRTLLVSRAHCPVAWQRLPAAPPFELVYADDGSVLWRLR
ncbi:MAG TPA: hypothetical protein VNN08_07145 [Thermoanaerobaculia bacterium]|nr:hypothetical protein [Thermoanaerobaculia bacterium]